jgi:precorrin-2 dehydrogenase / sirohydrochlorin ferrochelatase
MTSPPPAERLEAQETAGPTIFPIALKLTGRTVLVVGAGPVAWHKVQQLLAAGAAVNVVAPTACAEFQAAAGSAAFSWARRGFVADDLAGVDLVVTATGVAEVDHDVAAAAQARRIWVNAADQPEDCSFYMTANVIRGPVVVAVSTSGQSPALASYLRRRIDAWLEPDLARLAESVATARRHLRDEGVTLSAEAWAQVFDDGLVSLAAAHRWDDVADRLGSLAGDPA